MLRLVQRRQFCAAHDVNVQDATARDMAKRVRKLHLYVPRVLVRAAVCDFELIQKYVVEKLLEFIVIPLIVLPFILPLVLASSSSGDQHFCEVVKLCRPPSHQDWGRANTVGNRFARDDKELGPQLGETVTRRAASGNRRDVTHEPSAQPACSEERRRSAQRHRRADRTHH
jgi:hypothetical protein